MAQVTAGYSRNLELAMTGSLQVDVLFQLELNYRVLLHFKQC